MSRAISAAVALALLLGSSRSRGEGFDAQRFVPAAGAAGGLMVERPVVPRHLGFGAGLLLNWAYRPVVLRDEPTDEIVATPLRHALTFDLLGSIGLFDFLEVALHLPIHVLDGEEVLLGGQTLSADSGVGDLRLVHKVAFWLGGSPTINFSLGFSLPLSFPTGDEDALRGTGSVTLEPQVLFSMGAARWAATFSLGYRGRAGERTVDFAGGHALTWGAAGTFGLLTGRVPLDLQAELVGSYLAAADAPVTGTVPLEVLAGAIVWPHPDWSLYAAAGPGLTHGLGTPDVRVLVGVRFARRVPGRDRFTDRDADGVPDFRDDCPDTPEDYDGFQDEDGCPESDNDKDGIPDDRDECPTQAEEPGGNGDGCPDKGRVIVKRGKITIFGKVLFQTGSAEIDARSGPLLDQIATAVRENPEIGNLVVEGHTDDVGSADTNLLLSHQRAEAVRKALVQRGVSDSRLSASGRGESQPVAPNATPAGRARNRRVEFVTKRK